MSGGMRGLSRETVLLISLCLPPFCLSAEPGPRNGCQAARDKSEPVVELRVILEGMAAHRRMKAQSLGTYAVERTYKVENKRVNKRASLSASMIFVSPEEKLFEVHSYSGSGFMRRSVLNRLIEAERQSAKRDLQERVAVTPENYTFEFLRLENVKGRPQYVLRARPRRKHIFLFDGTIWVDGEDFAISRVEGRPAKAPSFWTRKTEFVHEYAKFGAFWFPVRNSSVTSVFIFGRTTTEIEYSNYQINEPFLLERAAELRKRDKNLEIQIDPADRKGN